MENSQKLHKVLANYGIGSRRTVEQWINKKRIKVNSQFAEIGQRVLPKDRIEFDNKRIRLTAKKSLPEWLIYHKPEGEVCSRTDPEKRPTVFKKLPRPRYGKWISIGRLDINSSGLLIFTNSGLDAHKLMHPSNEVERCYMVRVQGKLAQTELTELQQGIEIDKQSLSFKTIAFAGGQNNNFWYKVSLRQGHYREVRRLFEAINHQVGRLIRIKYGSIELPPNLKRGQWRYLEKKEFPIIPN